MKLAGYVALTAVVGIVVACGSSGDSTFRGDGADSGASSSSGSGFGSGGTSGTADGDAAACTNLCLRQTACGNGGATTVTGIVRDPAGKVPLYNVLVYVPNAPVAPITDGVSCDRCGSVSGDPLVTALTGVDGRFTLTNVPTGANIPLVVQIGKWRRQLTIANVSACGNTELDADTIRLPKNHTEGDLPKIALATGGLDTMECWLRKIGIDDTEFTTDSGSGRVNFYYGSEASQSSLSTRQFDAAHGGASFGKATDFWATESSLDRYDIVILSCEGVTQPDQKPPAALEAMHDYANKGGRIFASHYHRYWFDTSAKPAIDGDIAESAGPIVSPFEHVATWADRHNPCNDPAECVVYGTLNTSFAKGQAMHDWLAQPGVDALTNDQLPIIEARDNASAADSTTATEWIQLTNARENNENAVEYLSFNTPIPAADDQKCGRVVYSDLHVSAADTSGPPWPTGCVAGDLSPQEKALEFMLFDLSSCIQSDKIPPAPPIK